MTLSELIEMAIDHAVAGGDPDGSMAQKMKLEAESLAETAYNTLAIEVAGNPELRVRLEKNFSITLTNGIGTIPAEFLTEYLREGSVRDENGNVLQRVRNYNDLLQQSGPLFTAFGRYCLVSNQIYTAQIGTGDLTATVGPLSADAPFIPAKASLNTEVPDEIQSNLVEILALVIRGQLSRSMPASDPQ